MTPLPRLMLPAFLLMSCGPSVTPLPSAPVVSLALPAAQLNVGGRLALTASVANISCSLYIFFVDPAGQADQLLPNRTGPASPLAPDLRVDAGQVVAFPPTDARFTIVTTPPLGQYTVLAFASAKPLNLDAISSYATPNTPFATSKVSGLEPLSAALKLAADAQPGNLYSEARVPLSITP